MYVLTIKLHLYHSSSLSRWAQKSLRVWAWLLSDSLLPQQREWKVINTGVMAVSLENWWYFMPISGWQWAALMNDGPHNWCSQRGAWGSWISRLEHAAKLICFVRDGRRGEKRLLSFRQERSTWCQERRRCSSCCLRWNPTAPPPPLLLLLLPPDIRERTQTHTDTRGTHNRTPTALRLHKARVLPWLPILASCWTNGTLSQCHSFLCARTFPL